MVAFDIGKPRSGEESKAENLENEFPNPSGVFSFEVVPESLPGSPYGVELMLCAMRVRLRVGDVEGAGGQMMGGTMSDRNALYEVGRMEGVMVTCECTLNVQSPMTSKFVMANKKLGVTNM